MSKLIPLYRKRAVVAHAIVDDSDFEWLSKYKWFTRASGRSFYAIGMVDGVRIEMHRLILRSPKCDCDHINLNKLDNRRENLRPATRTQNNMNREKPRRRFAQSSQYKGVSFYKPYKKWRAAIAGQYLGYFDNEADAAKAYDTKAIELHGEYARLNFPQEH